MGVRLLFDCHKLSSPYGLEGQPKDVCQGDFCREISSEMCMQGSNFWGVISKDVSLVKQITLFCTYPFVK